MKEQWHGSSILVITPSSNLDTNTVIDREMERFLQRMEDHRRSPRNLILDLQYVTHVNALFLCDFGATSAMSRRTGKRLIVCNHRGITNQHIQHVFETLAETYETLEEALASFAPSVA